MSDPSVYILVEEDTDDEDKPVAVTMYDPDQGIDAPPGVEFQMTSDEANELETQLRRHRLMGLGMSEFLITSKEVQVGDIIADLGFTVEYIGHGQYGVDLSDSSSFRVVIQHGIEFKVNRPHQAPKPVQPEIDHGPLTEEEQILVDFVRQQLPNAKAGSDQCRREVEQGMRGLNDIMRKHMNDLDVMSARRVMLAIDELTAEVKG